MEQKQDELRSQSASGAAEPQAGGAAETPPTATASADGRPARLFAPVYDDDFDGPDPSEIKVFRVDQNKKVSNFVFVLVIILMGAVFPLMIFLSMFSARQAGGGDTVGQIVELARIFLG